MTKRTNMMREQKPGQHGGKRPGAGHPPGVSIFARTAGLTGPGAIHDVRQRHRQLIAEIQGSKRDPLLVLIDIATDKRKPDALRVEAAAVAVRYVHPALSATQVSLHHVQADQSTVMQLLTQRLDRLAPPDQPVIDAAVLPNPEQALVRPQETAEVVSACDQPGEPPDPDAPVEPWQALLEACAG